MFRSARLKLTAWYLVIIMCVSFIFSLLLYRVLAAEVERFDRAQRIRIERTFFQEPENSQLVVDAKEHIRNTLIFIDAIIFVTSAAVGYFLAGRTLQPIQDMVLEQNRFVSDASHELKTPLTSLKSAFEVYLRDKNKNLEDANVIIKESVIEVDKLKDLSESLLQLSQHEKLTQVSKFEKVNLKNVLTQACKKVDGLAKKKDITFSTTLQDANILGDKYALEELFVILLDNAIKYSGENSQVKIVIRKTINGAEVAISDSGIGIKKTDIAHIFDRFYRADTARSNNQNKGYGLGLSIAKKIVEAHKGTILVESKVNKGSTFTVQL